MRCCYWPDAGGAAPEAGHHPEKLDAPVGFDLLLMDIDGHELVALAGFSLSM